MALSVLATLGTKVGELLIAEGIYLRGVGDQVQQLQTELERIKRVLEDADTQQGEQHRSRDWISELRDLAYEADDVIETYISKVESQMGGGFMKKLKRCVCIFREGCIRHELGSEIQSLIRRISNYVDRFQGFGVRKMMEEEGSRSRQLQDLRRTYSHFTDEDNPIIGLDRDVDSLVHNLVREEYPLVSICGMGGLGKTTLAKRVYNHPDVKRHFQGYAWVCISQEWQARNVLHRILASLVEAARKDSIVQWNEEDLVRELSQVFQNKRCILVLDDVWTTNTWECIKQAYPARRNGSKILLTTRNKDVAMQVNDKVFLHEPRVLAEAESWELLKHKVFRGRDDPEMDKWEELGKKMLKHCGGLPLAVVVLGGILVRKYSLDEWNDVYCNIKDYLSKNQKIGQSDQTVQKILSLSYDDLPWRLKPCFLYLAKFSEDVDIESDKLYQMWMAEDLVLPEDRIGDESMMDVAQRYLGELAQRSMVRVKEKKLLPAAIRRFKSCSLHDMMRDLCLRIAERENFFKFVTHPQENDNSKAESSAPRRIYRLVSRLNGNDVSRYVAPKKEFSKHLRSFLFLIADGYTEGLPKTFRSQFKNFKMLRVLEIKGLEAMDMDDNQRKRKRTFLDHLLLFEAVSKLALLRYLSFKDCLFQILSPSVVNLEYLETLDLDSTVFLVPDILWRLKRLIHLHLPDPADELQTFRLRLGGLSKLERLVNFNSRYYAVKDLSKLTNLRTFEAIVEDEIDNLKEVISFISNSNKLKQTSLSISHCDFLNSENGSAVLKQALFCNNLHYLEITGPTGNLPRYDHTGNSSSLIRIDLLGCEIEEDPMMTLERLPNLQKLYLARISFSGRDMVCHESGFPKLKSLRLISLFNLENWKVEEGAMPSLLSVRISSCDKLEMLPEGLRFIGTLKELKITEMPTQFCERITGLDGQEGEESHKVCHVPSVFIR